MNVSVQLNHSINGNCSCIDDGYLRFERGPESMFRRIQIFDASGNLLENFENYNDMYCLTELLTNNAANRRGVATFHGEGFIHPYGSRIHSETFDDA
jgi:hypothetical protein